MSSEDPREREDLCGLLLRPKGRMQFELTKEYDSATQFVAVDGLHYCARRPWSNADDGRCIWHTDAVDKPPDELLVSLSDGPTRLDLAFLQDVEFPDGTSFSECRLTRADLGGAVLQEADFHGAVLQKADLRFANLQGADFSGADLRGTNLEGANLQEANMSGANLQEADLSGTVLREANFDDANLQEAKLEACSLHLTTLGDAIIDDSTTFGSRSGHEIKADIAAHSLILIPDTTSLFQPVDFQPRNGRKRQISVHHQSSPQTGA